MKRLLCLALVLLTNAAHAKTYTWYIAEHSGNCIPMAPTLRTHDDPTILYEHLMQRDKMLMAWGSPNVAIISFANRDTKPLIVVRGEQRCWEWQAARDS